MTPHPSPKTPLPPLRGGREDALGLVLTSQGLLPGTTFQCREKPRGSSFDLLFQSGLDFLPRTSHARVPGMQPFHRFVLRCIY